MPLYETVAFEFDSAEQIEANFKGEYAAHVYSRASSPTVEYFEKKQKANSPLIASALFCNIKQ